jgi:hypothetical protein
MEPTDTCRARLTHWILRLLLNLIELHNAKVKSAVPPDQLLVMSVKEGWGSLAPFLGKSTPVTPFPRVNDAEAAESVANGTIAKCLLVWAGLFATRGLGRLCDEVFAQAVVKAVPSFFLLRLVAPRP